LTGLNLGASREGAKRPPGVFFRAPGVITAVTSARWIAGRHAGTMPRVMTVQTLQIRLTVRLVALLACLTLPPLPPADAAGQGDASAAPTFDVLEFQVEGNTVLDARVIERTVYPFLGPDKTIEDVERARAALEQAYRQAGYGAALVDIPEQRVADGVVRLHVTESQVARTRVQGARYYSQGRILAQTPALKEGEPLNFPAVQKQVGALNDRPDRRVVPVLRPGSKFGTTEVDLNVDDRLPLHGNVELNNYYSPNTTELRLLAG